MRYFSLVLLLKVFKFVGGLMSNRTYTDQTFSENIDKFLTHPPVTEGTFNDPIYSIKMKFKVIIP